MFGFPLLMGRIPKLSSHSLDTTPLGDAYFPWAILQLQRSVYVYVCIWLDSLPFHPTGLPGDRNRHKTGGGTAKGEGGRAGVSPVEIASLQALQS